MAEYELQVGRIVVRADSFSPVEVVLLEALSSRVIITLDSSQAEQLGLALRSVAECSRHINEVVR